MQRRAPERRLAVVRMDVMSDAITAPINRRRTCTSWCFENRSRRWRVTTTISPEQRRCSGAIKRVILINSMLGAAVAADAWYSLAVRRYRCNYTRQAASGATTERTGKIHSKTPRPAIYWFPSTFATQWHLCCWKMFVFQYECSQLFFGTVILSTQIIHVVENAM